MSCGKCGKRKSACLCPFSFGLALGITSFLAVYIWGLWVVYHYAGMSPMMATLHMTALTATSALVYAGWAFLKGLIFGFVVVLLYDLIASVCLCCRKRKDGPCPCSKNGSCNCDASCDCGCNNKNKVNKVV